MRDAQLPACKGHVDVGNHAEPVEQSVVLRQVKRELHEPLIGVTAKYNVVAASAWLAQAVPDVENPHLRRWQECEAQWQAVRRPLRRAVSVQHHGLGLRGHGVPNSGVLAPAARDTPAVAILRRRPGGCDDAGKHPK